MKRVLLFFLLYCACHSVWAQNIPENMVLQDLKGGKIRLEDLLRDDEIVVITFWATWCKPCQGELEALLDIREAWEGKVRIIAISIDDSRAVAKVKSLVKGKRWPYEIYLDTNKELYQVLNLTSIPFSMVLGKGRKVLYTHSGYTPGDEVTLIERALKSSENRPEK